MDGRTEFKASTRSFLAISLRILTSRGASPLAVVVCSPGAMDEDGTMAILNLNNGHQEFSSCQLGHGIRRAVLPGSNLGVATRIGCFANEKLSPLLIDDQVNFI